MSSPVLWLAGSAPARRRAAALIARLSQSARVLTLGPAGDPAPDLVLGPAPDVTLALEACPPDLRPDALLVLEPNDPPPGRRACPAPPWPGEASAPPATPRPRPTPAPRPGPC